MDEGSSYYGKRSNFNDNYTYNERRKRRNLIDQRQLQDLSTEHTVYCYLCPKRKVGNVIGRGGEIVKQIRADTGAMIEIGETVQGCEERVVTISSSSKETNPFGYMKDYASPAQDALFRVHEMLLDELLGNNDDDSIGVRQVTARLLIPSDQARCIIGKRGHTIQSMRRDTGARINVWRDEHIPLCANSGEEILEISGDSLVVKEALFHVSCLLHEYPSWSHDPISYKLSCNRSGCHPICDPTTGSYPPKEESFEFTLRLVCPSVNIREVIGKGGAIINQIRQESGASIDLDCFFDEDDCVLFVSAKEFPGKSNSPTINAATQLQPRCSKKIESEVCEPLYVTRLLVPRSNVGGLIGKGGVIIKEMRRTTQTSISILEDSLPSIASEEDAMVQISGNLVNVREALIQVINQLKANLSARKSLFSTLPTASSHYMSRNTTHRSICTNRSFKSHNLGYSYSNEYGTSVSRVPLEIHAGYGGYQCLNDETSRDRHADQLK